MWGTVLAKINATSTVMKQKCQLQMDIAQYENVTTPLRTKGINTTHQQFQMRYVTLFQLKGPNIYMLKQKSKVSFTMEITYLKLDGR